MNLIINDRTFLRLNTSFNHDITLVRFSFFKFFCTFLSETNTSLLYNELMLAITIIGVAYTIPKLMQINVKFWANMLEIWKLFKQTRFQAQILNYHNTKLQTNITLWSLTLNQCKQHRLEQWQWIFNSISSRKEDVLCKPYPGE